jgi:hypothetical protein
MYAATTKDKDNAADGRFSTACKELAFIRMPESKEEVYEDLYQRDQRE